MLSLSESAVPVKWDKDQKTAIHSGSTARLLIFAGPGNGKTSVACARIAHLVNECDVESANVLLVSFTRTAVAELRNRIAQYVGSEAVTSGIRIATLDSASWSLLSGFGPDEKTPLGSFDQNIDRLCTELRSANDELMEYLQKFEHIIIDEAQDVLGLRAELVELLIEHASPACGVTVMADPCQAIYGFTGENGESKAKGTSELVKILVHSGRFETIKLNEIHRTSEPALLNLLKVTRPIVESATPDDQATYRSLRAKIETTAPPLAIKRQDLANAVTKQDDLLVLYRTRAEALMTSSILCSENVRHRLRISGLPSWLHPWVGAVFRDFDAPRIDKATFERIWNARGCDSMYAAPNPANAWQFCLRFAGQGSYVKLPQLKLVLSRSRPPVEFCMIDGAASGPTIGTIHASKGREADHVFLYLPQEPEGADVHWDEEARVLYVGATRARKSVKVAAGGRVYCTYVVGRPVRCFKNEKAAQFEVGRADDLDEISVASASVHSTEQAASDLQSLLQSSSGDIRKLTAISKSSWEWRYRLHDAESGTQLPFGDLSELFSKDLLQTARIMEAKRPGLIPHIWQVGVRTVVLPPDSQKKNMLVAPFDRTGIFLVPVLRAWTKAYFREGYSK